jgi:hypothetical protein
MSFRSSCAASFAIHCTPAVSSPQNLEGCFVAQVNGRIIPKRIHVRIEHVHPSRCKEEFLRRVKANDEFKHEAKLKGGVCQFTLVLSGCQDSGSLTRNTTCPEPSGDVSAMLM